MALATKCPHCNTVFRVTHDQLKLRGGIVRCGSCNEVFDGNAALLEPSTPIPVPPLPATAELTPEAAEPAFAPDAPQDAATETTETPQIAPEPEPEPEPAEPEPEPEPEPDEPEPVAPPADDEAPLTEEPLLPNDNLSEDELAAALEAELAVMEQSLADDQNDNDTTPVNDNGRREPTWDDLQTDAGATPPATAPEPGTRAPRDDELDEVDEEALLHLSSATMSHAEVAGAHTYLLGPGAEEAPAHEAHAEPDEPGFVKRDRLRRKYGKAATIAMSLGSLLLVLALFGQTVTTFRDTLAASVPALKPALSAACEALGCKIALPAQIDYLMIEQGELQTLSENTFSFTTLLRNQSRTAQAWPSIELSLDDANDKRILRRVFTPRDYLGASAALEQGFAPRSEQAVKLYFELRELKASGYHIAVFYP